MWDVYYVYAVHYVCDVYHVYYVVRSHIEQKPTSEVLHQCYLSLSCVCVCV